MYMNFIKMPPFRFYLKILIVYIQMIALLYWKVFVRGCV